MLSKGAAALGLLVASAVFLSCASVPSSSSEKQAAATKGEGSEKTESRVRAQEIVSGDAQKAAPAPAAEAASAPDASVEVSQKDKQYLDGYLKRLKYMMVVSEGSALNEFQARSVVTKGNEYLLRQGFDVVSWDQLQKNMEDQRTAFEAEAGESMTLVQYIAQKLGADVYVELNAVPRAWTEGARHYGEAAFTANLFDPSTSELLASVTFKTDRSLSNSSPDDALLNALVAGTAQFMPRVARDSTSVLRNRYSNGIRYQLIVQKTPDSRVVSVFRRNLRSRVREIQSGPSAADQTIFDVYLFGSISELEDACYAAFEKTPGMENAYAVFTRGKTITFNSGN